jgi:hypothetical protein
MVFGCVNRLGGGIDRYDKFNISSIAIGGDLVTLSNRGCQLFDRSGVPFRDQLCRWRYFRYPNWLVDGNVSSIISTLRISVDFFRSIPVTALFPLFLITEQKILFWVGK